MAKIVLNRYVFSIKEIIGEFLIRQKYIKMPKIEFTNEDSYLKVNINDAAADDDIYIYKNALKQYEIYAAYIETFLNPNINGHSYVRAEMRIREGDIVVDAGVCEGLFTKYALNCQTANCNRV